MSQNMEQIRVKISQYADRKYLIMYYVDPVTRKPVSRSTKKTSRRDAERVAAVWEAELNSGRYRADPHMTWKAFRQKYETEKLASLAPKSQDATFTAFTHLETLVDPARLSSLNDGVLSTFQAKLRETGLKETSIASYLRHIRAALGWAASMGYLPRMPKIHMPKRARGKTLMRGRPISDAEFAKLLKAVPKVRRHDAQTWTHYLEGLWLSGLRLEESTVLSWDEDSPIWIDLGGRHPQMRIYAEAEKGHQDRKLPITPDFVQFLSRTPASKRSGSVFKLIGLQTGKPITPARICRIVAAIGEKADVVVDKREERFVTAHDLRRSFATRWASKVKPATLQRLMRHRSIETTLKYYVDQDADEIADELWRQHGGINTFINSGGFDGPQADETQPDAASQVHENE